MQNQLSDIEDKITESSTWEIFIDFLGNTVYANKDESIKITVGLILLVAVIYVLTTIVLTVTRKIVTRHLPKNDKAKFNTVFSFGRWLVYLVVLLIVFDSVGVNVTAIFAASAALLIGVGLALQTLVDHTQVNVNGWVRVKLYKGSVSVVSRDSKTDSLFDEEIATFEDDEGAYDQKDAEGFIKLNALRLRIAEKFRTSKK